MGELRQSYRGTWEILSRYWRLYGGTKSFLASPYLHFSILLALATYHLWAKEGWWEKVYEIVPCLLGFSLAGFAVFLAFGSDDFKRLMSGKDEGAATSESPFLQFASAFTHFVVVQIASLIAALCAAGLVEAMPPVTPWLLAVNNIARLVWWGFGFWLFLYSVCLSAATLFGIFRAATLFDTYVSESENGRANTGATLAPREEKRTKSP